MRHRWHRSGWWLLLVPVVLGLARLRFDADILGLLPQDLPAVAGVKLFQQQFSNARELIVTVESPSAERSEAAARAIAELLSKQTNQIESVLWEPPWLEHPEQAAELIAHLWLNQPPAELAQLAQRLSVTNLATVLSESREQLATTLSPMEFAQLSYDPFGFTRLPESVVSTAPGFGQGHEFFASPDGKFRILFVKARIELAGYRECTAWFEAVKRCTAPAVGDGVTVGFTGRPAFVAEISASMKRDIAGSVAGTAAFIALLFWLAHRRWKPMLWLLTLLGAILVGTLGLGGLLFGTIHVLSMGFAAILLGLAVDYAVVHYQEALAHPDLSVRQIRRAIAPSIFWAAFTTIAAFLVLNFGGLPGLAQLGSLVALGMVLSALVMIFAYLPPLFPGRMDLPVPSLSPPPASSRAEIAGASRGSDVALTPGRRKLVFGVTLVLAGLSASILLRGWPRLDPSAKALEPRASQAYAALEEIKQHLNQNRDPLWLIFSGQDEGEVARRLEAVEPILREFVSNRTLASFVLPTVLWPRPEYQAANRGTASRLVTQAASFQTAALAEGFSEQALGLARGVLDSWQSALASPKVFWPTNDLGRWAFEKFSARGGTNLYAAGFLVPANRAPGALQALARQLPTEGVWLGGWSLLGDTLLGVVRRNLWKLVLPMAGLVLVSLWLAFRRLTEILLSVGVLLMSGLILLATMRMAGWSWNLLNLMALPLILGTGVDYSLFMQLALRRHGGNLTVAHRSVGRALLLCGGTAVAGFGSLGFSTNAGMASLGQVCAAGIAANMLLSVFLLPVWWKMLVPHRPETRSGSRRPSFLYSAKLWALGLLITRMLPPRTLQAMAGVAAAVYWRLAAHRREVVVQNLLPVLQNDRQAARRTAREMVHQFAAKIVDLWRYEAGIDVTTTKTNWQGWPLFEAAQARGRGVLLVTPHLGNWELGAEFFARHGVPLLVLTQPEPEGELTRMRQAARTRRGIETFVVGADAFAFVEIIKRLQAGGTVALLVDRPPAPTAVQVELFGKRFAGSIAPAELARAAGCAILPAIVVRTSTGYDAAILPEIPYDRATIGDRVGRVRLTQEILRAFEPSIRQHASQWYHFIPIWPSAGGRPCSDGAGVGPSP